jgi:hypothetical protein
LGKRPSTTAKRLQCFRDDKLNGTYLTFRILDLLRPILDEEDKISSRPMYWKPSPRRSTITSIAPPSPEPIKKASVKTTRKSLPPPKPEAATAKSIQSKKRKSAPATLEAPLNENQVTIVNNAWSRLREKHPGLPEVPPEIRLPLNGFASNKTPSYLTPFQPSNHFPNVGGGGSSWPLDKMNLATHPPSGPPIAGLSPPRAPTKTEVVRPPPTHGYGTRARGRPGSTAVVDRRVTLTPEMDDTNVFQPTAEDGGPKEESRIKRLSGISNIMSADSSPSSEAFYSAEETMIDS